MHVINKYIFLTLVLCHSLYGMSQDQGEVYRLCESGFNQIENRTPLQSHFIDTISGLYRLRIKAGLAHDLNEVQLKLGYFNLLIYDDIVKYDAFFLGPFDTLIPGVIDACKEFGFYQLVRVLEDIEEHRNKNLSVFQSDTTKSIFNMYSDNFDYTLYKLRGKLNVICDRIQYLDRLRTYLIENKSEIMK